MKTTEDGWAEIRKWNPTYKANHRPTWFKEKVRLLHQLKDGEYKPLTRIMVGYSLVYYYRGGMGAEAPVLITNLPSLIPYF